MENKIQEDKRLIITSGYGIEERGGNVLAKDISAFLKLLSYFQVGIGFFALIITGTLGPISSIIILISLLASWFCPPKVYKRPVYQRIWSLSSHMYSSRL